MNLRTYLNSLPKPQQEDFATRCGTTLNYLRKGISAKQNFSGELTLNLEKESGGVVTVEEVRPDLNERWDYIRGTRCPKGSKAA